MLLIVAHAASSVSVTAAKDDTITFSLFVDFHPYHTIDIDPEISAAVPRITYASVISMEIATYSCSSQTVTQSTFADPCTRMTTPKEGIDSGFAPVAADATSLPQWTITIDDPSTPLWFFCAQTQHCQMGMVFAVNPTADKTFEAFQVCDLVIFLD